MRLSLDGVPVDLSQRMVFKGTMLAGLPKLCFVFGYVNAPWTFRADLVSTFFRRLLKALDARSGAVCVVQRPESETGDRPRLDFRPGYIERALRHLARQGSGSPPRPSTYAGQGALASLRDSRQSRGAPAP